MYEINRSLCCPQTASTQTDGVKASAPPPRILKNKALLCKPFCQNKGTSCKPNVCDMNTQTGTRNQCCRHVSSGHCVCWLSLVHICCPLDGPSVIVLPVPVPVYVPVPMNLYTQYTPKSVGLPLPVSISTSSHLKLQNFGGGGMLKIIFKTNEN